jgi:hypothetical protein
VTPCRVAAAAAAQPGVQRRDRLATAIAWKDSLASGTGFGADEVRDHRTPTPRFELRAATSSVGARADPLLGGSGVEGEVALRAEDVRSWEIFAAKVYVRAAAELVRWRFRTRATDTKRRAEVALVDGLVIGRMVIGVVWGATQATILGRWIITGRGRGVRALVLSL